MSSQSAKIKRILEETTTWENVPINRALGSLSTDKTASLIKRIIMFGATQMGKTTVIMSLLGIKVEKRKELEEILRGGAKYGESSTSTTVIYLHSKSSDFGYYEGDINSTVEESKVKYYPSEAFKDILSGLKKAKKAAVNTDRDAIFHVSYIYIPECFFEDNANMNLQIVDSRGFGERNSKTRKGDLISTEQINTFIDSLMRFASGVIAVVGAEKVESLKSDYKEILEEKNKNQVLIIITRALDRNQSLLKKISNSNPEKDANSLIEYYNKILTDNVDFGAAYNGRVFPFEKKDWLIERNYNGEIVDCINRKILSKIDKMNCKTKISVCRNEFEQRIHGCEKRIEKCEKNIDDCKNEVEKVKKNKCIFEMALKKAMNKLNEQEEERRSQLNAVAEVENICNTITNNLTHNIPFYSRQESVRDYAYECDKANNFNRYSYNDLFYHIVSEAVLQHFSGINDEYRNIIENETNSFLDNKIDNYYPENGFPRGFFRKEKKLNDWINGVYWQAKCAEERCLREILDKMKEKNERLKAEIEGRDSALKKEKDALSVSVSSYEKKQSELEKQILSFEEEIEKYKNDIEEDEEKKKNISDIFVNAFYEKEEELYKRINVEKDPDVKTALMITLLTIRANMNDIIKTCENKGGTSVV